MRIEHYKTIDFTNYTCPICQCLPAVRKRKRRQAVQRPFKCENNILKNTYQTISTSKQAKQVSPRLNYCSIRGSAPDYDTGTSFYMKRLSVRSPDSDTDLRYDISQTFA